MAAFFIAATMANIGLPGFANFWGELSVFVALWQYEPWVLFPAALGVIISAIYGLRAVARIFFSQPTEVLAQSFDSGVVNDLTWAERIPCLVLLAALLLAGLFPTLLSDAIEEGVDSAHYTLSPDEIKSAQLALTQQHSL
jgi:NADH-quinone oxidoreductase subunit M